MSSKNPKSESDGIGAEDFEFMADPFPLPPLPPSTFQLASLAAQLASGMERSLEDFSELSKRALALWNSAHKVLTEAPKKVISESEYRKMRLMKRFKEAGIELPPKDCVLTLNKVLSHLMKKRGVGDRTKALRDFLAENAEVELSMGELRERGFTYVQFCRFADSFLPWLDDYVKRKRAKAGKAGGMARSMKKSAASVGKKRRS